MIEHQPGLLHLAYPGSCDTVLRWVTQFPVERIETPLQGGEISGPANPNKLAKEKRPINPSVPFPFTLFRFWFLRILPMWSGAALVIFLMQISVCAIVHDNQNVRAFLKFLNLLPSFVKTALGGDMLQVGNTSALIRHWISASVGLIPLPAVCGGCSDTPINR